MRKQAGLWIAAVIAVGAIGGNVVAQTLRTVSLNGKPVSSDVIEQEGKAYVPLSDVAKLLNRTAVKQSDGNYALVAEEGKGEPVLAPPLIPLVPEKKTNGLKGEVGDALTNGQVVFTVSGVKRGTEYASPRTQKKYTADAGAEYVILTCTLKNATKRVRQFDLGYFKSGKTALIDTTDHSYAPSQWDRREPIAKLTAGATSDFVVLFAVPKGTVGKEFVYEVRPNDFDRTMRTDEFRVRISATESIP